MAEIKEKQIELKNPLYRVKDSNVNDIGATAIKFLQKNKLEPGKVVTFRLLKKKPNPDPKKKAEDGFIFPNTALRTQFWINDKENGAIEIAAVQNVNRDGSFRIKKFHADGSLNKGIFQLYGDSVEHQLIFPYLMLSPENQSSPFFNKMDEPLYEMVDSVMDAKKNVNRTSSLLTCLQAISVMGDADLKLYNLAFGGSVHDDPYIMKDRMNKMALKNPDDFVKKIEAPAVKIKAMVRQATELDIIQYDPMQHRFLWVKSQDTIATLDRVDDLSEVDQFVEWLETNTSGPEIQKMILSQLKK